MRTLLLILLLSACGHDSTSCFTRKEQCERVTVDAVIVVQPIDAR